MTKRKNVEQLDDETFLTQLENLTLDPAQFTHLGHLRLAWIYLCHQDTETASRRACSSIKAYAEHQGAPGKFHLTVTDAFVRIMARRIDERQDRTWSSFLNVNRDLVEDAVSVLLTYFSEDLLSSETARTSLVKPDLQPI